MKEFDLVFTAFFYVSVITAARSINQLIGQGTRYIGNDNQPGILKFLVNLTRQIHKEEY